MSLRKTLADALKRSTAAVVPPPFGYLFDPSRYKVNYGGRGAGRSWSFARALILRAQDRKTRILCAREIQASISESVHKLLSDQIELLGFSDFFEIQTYSISGRNGSEFLFEGLRANVSKIKSLEGIDVAWVEEAETITENSWTTLIPTIRKKGSEIWVTFNPYLASDPTYKRFVESPPPNAVVRKTTFRDNPYFPEELETERLYLQSVDEDAYRWIWEGECRQISDALILKGKFHVESFEVQPQWSGPHHGLDFGFSRDPSAAVRLYIDDASRTLYVKSEFWALGCDIDALPGALETAIPGISQYVVFCDNSRPESISYLARKGVPNARAADKWSGSVNDGIAYLRSFERIVIDPACKHFIDEARSYSYRLDRLTGLPLPEAEDRFNHLMDSARYALSPLIRNLPMSGFFSRSALLLKGRPMEAADQGRPDKIFAVLTMTDRTASAVGLVIFASSPHHGIPLIIVGYDLAEIETVLAPGWLEEVFDRMRALGREWNPVNPPELHIETNEFGQAVITRALEHADQHAWAGHLLHVFEIEADTLEPTIDERAMKIRTVVNAGQFVKLAQLAADHQVTHRNVTTNHLLSQILGYRADARDTAQEVLSAFCTGVALTVVPH